MFLLYQFILLGVIKIEDVGVDQDLQQIGKDENEKTAEIDQETIGNGMKRKEKDLDQGPETENSK